MCITNWLKIDNFLFACYGTVYQCNVWVLGNNFWVYIEFVAEPAECFIWYIGITQDMTGYFSVSVFLEILE